MCRLEGWFAWVKGDIVLSYGVEISDGMGQFWGLFGPWKALGGSATVYAAKRISQSPITAQKHVCYSRQQCCRLVGVTRHCPRKNSSPCDAAFCPLFFELRVTGMRRRVERAAYRGGSEAVVRLVAGMSHSVDWRSHFGACCSSHWWCGWRWGRLEWLVMQRSGRDDLRRRHRRQTLNHSLPWRLVLHKYQH